MTNLLIKLFIKNEKNLSKQDLREKYGVLSGYVGIFCNVILCFLKFLAGIMSSSIAIIADAFNNLSDAASSVITLFGFKISNKPADKQHPFGYGRVEYVSGLIISIIIVFMGIKLVKSSIEKLISNETSDINFTSLLILIFSLLIKFWLYTFYKKLGKKINSIALKTISFDNLSDAISTCTVIIGLIITFFTHVSVDGYSGIIVAMFITYTGINTAKSTLQPLLGQRPEKNFIEKIKSQVLLHQEIIGVHDIVVHNYGPTKSLISLHVEVPSNMSVIRLHKVVDKIECELKEKYDCVVVIHTDPIIVNQKIIDEISPKILKFLTNTEKNIVAENFRLIEDEGKINIVFDMLIPDNLDTESLTKSVKKYVNSINENYICIINSQKYKIKS